MIGFKQMHNSTDANVSVQCSIHTNIDFLFCVCRAGMGFPHFSMQTATAVIGLLGSTAVLHVTGSSFLSDIYSNDVYNKMLWESVRPYSGCSYNIQHLTKSCGFKSYGVFVPDLTEQWDFHFETHILLSYNISEMLTLRGLRLITQGFVFLRKCSFGTTLFIRTVTLSSCSSSASVSCAFTLREHRRHTYSRFTAEVIIRVTVVG